MAEHLARIIGTEEDRVNCPFYWKIGACRHGDQCSRSHYKPTASQTLILRHMYQNPPVALAIAEGQDVTDEAADEAQDHFEAFVEEVFTELTKYGEIEEIVACDNIGDHMIGNVYVKYINEDSAEEALKRLTGRYYAGRLLQVEYSPVTDFREARCRQFVDGQCTRGGYCNFMHMKHIPRSLKRKMIRTMYENYPDYKANAENRGGGEAERREEDDHRRRDRSRSRDRDSRRGDRDRDRERYRDRSRDRDRDRNNRRGDRGYDRNSRRDRGPEPDDPKKRTASEERRAMIASWNEELEAEGGNDNQKNDE